MTNEVILGQYLYAIACAANAVMHYDHIGLMLALWSWPMDEYGVRIAPAGLIDHRESHCMSLPCCLCSSLPGRGSRESAVYRATAGPYRGQYIASCADGGCGYVVNLERIYAQEGVHTKYYGPRDINDTSPAIITVTNEAHLRRINARAIAVYHPPAPVPATPFDLLMRLDSHSQPGIPLDQFLGLFVQCASCRLVMTMRATSVHNCAPATGKPGVGGVIDLTEDSE
ncbi:hypothetical protein BV25DRAFT_1914420 [Artomyces pyxidatus]|uniref:Uncharacterized protein n=1 Tax=Artomyces pyxidatus TaxID=48021 RepID=A0ACB8T856_9AGAM|nr:hypothetical protein BV25DRAFT_1914420 [Artomyces pyxidatus]